MDDSNSEIKRINDITVEGMNAAYHETCFRWEGHPTAFPKEFAVISACATTGEQWTASATQIADLALDAELRRRSTWVHRIIGYSPTSGHTEPSWAVQLPLAEACEIGLKYQQDAIYFIRGNSLFVSFCDSRRELVEIGPFRAVT